MNSVFRLVAAFAAGAAAMYYLDPATGRRRRALVRDQAVSARHDAEYYARAKSKRAVDRMHGAVARTRSKISPQPVDDERLHERIRSKLGRVVDRPSAVEVEVHEGRVVLSGNALETEIDEAVQTVSAIPGVKDLENRLSPRTGNGAPGAQDVQH